MATIPKFFPWCLCRLHRGKRFPSLCSRLLPHWARHWLRLHVWYVGLVCNGNGIVLVYCGWLQIICLLMKIISNHKLQSTYWRWKKEFSIYFISCKCFKFVFEREFTTSFSVLYRFKCQSNGRLCGLDDREVVYVFQTNWQSCRWQTERQPGETPSFPCISRFPSNLWFNSKHTKITFTPRNYEYQTTTMLHAKTF